MLCLTFFTFQQNVFKGRLLPNLLMIFAARKLNRLKLKCNFIKQFTSLCYPGHNNLDDLWLAQASTISSADIFIWISEESTFCKHDGTPKGFCTSNSLLSQKWFPNGQVLNQKVLIYHKSTWNVHKYKMVQRGKWKLGNLRCCVTLEKPDPKSQILVP